MNHSRPIDRWFMANVLPHETTYVRFARRWVNSQETALDMVQDAYLKMLQLDNWAEVQNPRAYMPTVIHHLVVQQIRRDKIVSFVDAASTNMDAVLDDVPDALDTACARDALVKLAEAVETLPPMCRRVIQLRKFEDRSPTEISRELGISISTVETHLSRGMRQLLQWQRQATELTA